MEFDVIQFLKECTKDLYVGSELEGLILCKNSYSIDRITCSYRKLSTALHGILKQLHAGISGEHNYTGVRELLANLTEKCIPKFVRCGLLRPHRQAPV
ncbi:hypothetical protein ASF64_18595 [Arthrobacter sp. Leaf137]|nr:hypothetical protein ASF64_18595 [Arthrobacter sp. Leaf137]